MPNFLMWWRTTHPVPTGCNTIGLDLPVLLIRATVHQVEMGDFTQSLHPSPFTLHPSAEDLAVFLILMPGIIACKSHGIPAGSVVEGPGSC